MRTIAACVLGLLPLVLACTPRQPPRGEGSEGREQDKAAQTSAAADTSAPWVLLEKSGGIAGFRLSLSVDGSGKWVARDLARDRERSGTYAPAQFDSIRTGLAGLPAAAWGTFPSQVVDDFHYRISWRTASGQRELNGGGTQLHPDWVPVLENLERPFALLFSEP